MARGGCIASVHYGRAAFCALGRLTCRSGEATINASSCSGSSRWSSDVELAVSPSGRHSRPCCLSMRQPV